MTQLREQTNCKSRKSGSAFRNPTPELASVPIGRAVERGEAVDLRISLQEAGWEDNAPKEQCAKENKW